MTLVSATEHELYPLSAFCLRDGIELPSYRVIAAAELPEPYRRLLVHRGDMTSVLQEFHAQSIHLENVEVVREAEHVLRRVVLFGEDGRPVEFGAIDIWLPHFADDAQRDILACHTPFGPFCIVMKSAIQARQRDFSRLNRSVSSAKPLDWSRPPGSTGGRTFCAQKTIK